jgi:hypothetical protein
MLFVSNIANIVDSMLYINDLLSIFLIYKQILVVFFNTF